MRRRAVLAGVSAAALVGRARALPPLRQAAQVVPGIYVRQGRIEDATAENLDAIANIGFIVGHDSVAVIDPGGGSDDGATLRELVGVVTPLPVKYVILTHVHPDHVFGAGAFAADKPEVVGHARLAGALAERGAFYRRRQVALLGEAGAGVAPTVTRPVADTVDLDLGGRVLTVRAHPTAHTDNDLSIVDANEGVLWAGDLVFVGRVPSVDGSLRGWLAQLDVLAALPGVTQVVPGHGPMIAPWPDAQAPMRRYLTKLRDETRALIKRGGDIADAPKLVAQSERAAWSLFDDYNPRNAQVAYKELEWE